MAGYSGQMIALDANTPTETELAGAQADEAQTRARMMKAMAPSQIDLASQQAQAARMSNQANALTLRQQMQLDAYKQHMVDKLDQQVPQQSSPLTSPSSQAAPALQSSPLFDPRVQQVMQSIDPNDPDAASKWDAAMSELGATVPQAKQFVGQYSRANVNEWRSQIGSHTYHSALQSPDDLPPVDQSASFDQAFSPLMGGQTPQQGNSPLAAPTPSAPVSPLTGQPDTTMQKFAIQFPKEYGEYAKMQGMMRYQQTGNPEDLRRYAPEVYKELASAEQSMTSAQKERLETHADMMGRAANGVLALAAQLGKDAPEVRAAYNEGIVQGAREGWIAPQAARQMIANPIDWGRLSYVATYGQTIAGYMKASGQEARNEAQARQAYPENRFMYAGTDQGGKAILLNTGSGQLTNTGTQIGAKPSAAMEVFNAKQQAWLEAHPGDTTGAVAFAGGKRDMSPAQIATAAQNMALREQQTAALTGQPFDLNASYQNHLALIQAANVPQQQGGATQANPNTPTPAQLQAAKPFAGAKDKVGTQGNPAMPVSKAQYDGLPKGAVYIGGDGKLRRKS